MQITSFANISNCVAKSFVYLYRRIKKYIRQQKRVVLRKKKKLLVVFYFLIFFFSIVFKNSNILYIFFSILIMLVCLIFIFIFSHSFATFFLFCIFEAVFLSKQRDFLAFWIPRSNIPMVYMFFFFSVLAFQDIVKVFI